MRSDFEILAELKRRKAAGNLSANDPFLRGDTSPLNEHEVAVAECQLGFAIPPLLRLIYREITNGGFGDAYGFLGLVNGSVNEDGNDIISLYDAYRQPDSTDPHWNWPSGLLPLCHLGCAMYHCVDCNTPPFPVIWFEPNPHENGQPWDDSFIPFCPSLAQYLCCWLDGVDLWSALEEP